MNRLSFAIAAALAVTAAPTLAFAADYTVCDSGCVFQDIQAAIDFSQANGSGNDKIYIHPGQYDETLNITHDVELKAVSSSMGTVDIIGDGVSPVMTVGTNADVIVRRIDFLDGGGLAGIVNFGTLKLVKTYVLDCDTDWGGIANFGGDLTVKKFSVVANNTGQYGGGGISNLSGTLLIDNVTVTGNHGYLGGGLHNSFGSSTVSSSSFSFNNAASLGGAWSNHNIGGVVDFQSSSSYSSNNANDCDKSYDVDATPSCVN